MCPIIAGIAIGVACFLAGLLVGGVLASDDKPADAPPEGAYNYHRLND